MNVILLSKADFTDLTTVRLEGRRLKHVREVHRAVPGDNLRVGLIGGRLGHGLITRISETEAELTVSLDSGPPAPLPLTLLIALPRPKSIPRILQAATNLGIKEIFFLNTYRVEKIYWSCQQLQAEEMQKSMLLGLEQGRDTVLPRVHLRRLFKPFVEDELPGLSDKTTPLVAHPSAPEACPFNLAGPITLAIGPEGGFIDYELDKLVSIGFKPVRTLERILKVETALASIVGRLL